MDYGPLIAQAATNNGLDPNVLKGLLASESSLQPNATGAVMKDGTTAKGIAQLTDPTAKALGVTDPYDPQQAIPAAAALLAQNLKAANGDVPTAIKMYKGGSDPSQWGAATNAGTQHALTLAGGYASQSASASDPVSQFLASKLAAAPVPAMSPPTPADPVTSFLQSKLEASKPQPAAPNAVTTDTGNTVSTVPSMTNGPAPAPAQTNVLQAINDAPTLGSVAEAGLGIVGGLASQAVGTVYGIGKSIANGTYGTQQGVQQAANTAGQVMDKTALPQSPGAQKIAAAVSDAMDKSGIVALGPDLQLAHAASEGISTGAKTGNAAVAAQKGAQAAEKIEPTLTIDPNAPKPSSPPAPVNPTPPPLAGSASPLDMPAPEPEAPGVEGSIFSPEEMEQRGAVLQRIGMTQARASALAGDVKGAGTDFQQAKLDEPSGVLMDNQIQSEQAALSSHADDIAKGLGGVLGQNETGLAAKGQAITAPLEAYKDFYDDQIQSAYKAADQAAAGKPSVTLDPLTDFLDTDSNFQGQRASLRSGMHAYMQEQGIMDPEGNVGPVTAQQAEGIRQYANTQWNPDNSRLVGQIKDAVDDSVTQAAGPNVYAQARELRAQRGRILDDPNLVRKIMGVDDQNPMNRTVDFDNVPKEIEKSSPAQFEHLIKVYQSMPEALQPQAQRAIATINTHFAERAGEAGVPTNAGPDYGWSSKKVADYIDDNAAKIKISMPVEAQQQLADLRDAGKILQMRKAYPGAEAQRANFARRWLATGTQAGATAAGVGAGSLLLPYVGHAGPMAGGALGNAMGQLMTKGVAERGALKATKARLVRLGDLGAP